MFDPDIPGKYHNDGDDDNNNNDDDGNNNIVWLLFNEIHTRSFYHLLWYFSYGAC